MTTRPYLRVALLSLTVASFACSSEEEAPNRAATPSGAETESRTAPAVPSTPGAESTATAGLGDGIPKDMPLYPSARVFAAQRVETEGNDVAVTFQSDDSVEDVMDYYRDAISEQDWELEDETALDDTGGVISAWKGNRQLVILTGTNGVETVIGVKIMEGKGR